MAVPKRKVSKMKRRQRQAADHPQQNGQYPYLPDLLFPKGHTLDLHFPSPRMISADRFSENRFPRKEQSFHPYIRKIPLTD